MNKHNLIFNLLIFVLIAGACAPPAPPKKKSATVKHNYIILLDLSDRLIIQKEQPDRDKTIIRSIFDVFEQKVKKELYIRSRDEIKVVIAPQRGSGIQADIFEDNLYINMGTIPNIYRRAKEAERKDTFNTSLDKLYKKAVFSKNPLDYYGADIWKYFYEDLKNDYSNDTLTSNFLFIITDGYPIVGKDPQKLQPVKNAFPDLHVILVEACPRDKDMEWDRLMDLWAKWFNDMNINKYTLIKRKAITKEIEQIKDIVSK